MTRAVDRLITACAPVIWGSTYIVTTEVLPPAMPVTVAMLRALPAGLLLLLMVRRLPTGAWWGRSLILGALNFTVFWICLFVAAYRLPGGVAATLGAVQPLVVMGLARLALGEAVRPLAVLGALVGVAGVALLVLSPGAQLDAVGVLAALGGAASMAGGTVLTRRWSSEAPLLTMTAWQLTAGGLLLVPLARWLEPGLPVLNGGHLLGLAWLSIVGAALTYVLWFRGIARLGPTETTVLGFLSPVSAMLLGRLLLGEGLGPVQLLATALIGASIRFSQSPRESSGLTPITPLHPRRTP